VVIVDEAQNLSNSVLETIRLLSDFETPRSKLLQVVLAGQTELRDRLALPALVQFRQRMSMMSALAPLDRRQVTDYIAHRLQVAGYRGSPLFTPEACDLIADFSSGIPRNVNNICFQAMSLGCVHRVTRIDIEILREVIKDLNWQTARPAPVEHALTPRIIAEERKWEGTVRPAETHGKPELQPNRTRAVLTADNSPHQGSQGFLPRVPAPWRIGTQWSRSAALVTVVSVIFIVGVVLIWRGEAFLNWRNEGFPNPQKLALTNNQGVMLNPAQLSAGTAPPTTSVHTASTHGSGSRRLVPAHVPTEERLIEATTPQPNSKAPQMPAIDPQSAAPSDRSVKLPTTIPNNDFGMAKDSEMNVTPGAKPPDQNLFTGGAISSITSKKSDPPLTSISEKTSGSAPDVSSNTPPENPEPNKIIEGALLKMVRPTYPEVALRARIQGDVVLSAMVTKDGNVRDVRVISGHPTLTSAAVNAVKQWRYEASLVNGRPEDVRKEIVVKFNLASR
jgi:TonB family protein